MDDGRSKSDVLLFMQMVRELGGEYVPFREWDAPSSKKTGRRFEPPFPRPLRMSVNGVQVYARTKRGYIVRLSEPSLPGFDRQAKQKVKK